jgi:hypothetical protein
VLGSFSDGEPDGEREMSLDFISTTSDTCLAPEGHEQVATENLPDDESYKAHEMGVDKCSSTESPTEHCQEADRDTAVSDSEDKDNINYTETRPRLLTFARQVRPLAQRMHRQYGWGIRDIVTANFALNILAALLSFETIFVQQVVLMTLSLVTVPVILFSHKIIEYVQMWLAHRQELDDQRVSIVAFQIASSVLMFPVPIMSLILAALPSCAILEWKYDTIFDQILFAVANMLITLQLGRILAIWYRGKVHSMMKVFIVILFLSFSFSSVPVANHKLPPYLRWLVLFSSAFWAISGAVIKINLTGSTTQTMKTVLIY